MDRAAEVVNQAVERGVKLEDIKYSSLRSLESSFKEAGRPFPFVIPKLVILILIFKLLFYLKFSKISILFSQKAKSLRTEE